MNKNDQFFRDKLENLEMTPRKEAWSRVESQLDKKAFPFWRVAAALVPLALVAGWYLLSESSTSTQQGSYATVTPQSEQATTLEESSRKTPEVNSTTAVSEIHSPSRPSNALASNSNTNTNKEVSTEMTSSQPSPEETQLAVDEVVNTEEVGVVAVATTEEVSSEAMNHVNTISEDNISMKFSVADVEEYQKILADEATQTRKKTSSLQRLLAKARNLTEDPMGELRSRKDEILALNFKNSRTREADR